MIIVVVVVIVIVISLFVNNIIVRIISVFLINLVRGGQQRTCVKSPASLVPATPYHCCSLCVFRFRCALLLTCNPIQLVQDKT